MIASTIGLTVIAAALSVFFYAGKRGFSLSHQIDFTGQARSLIVQFTDLVEQTKCVLIENSTSILLYYADSATTPTPPTARICFVDQDGDETTLKDNAIRLFPDADDDSVSTVLCDSVTPLDNLDMLRLISGSPLTIGLALHIGDSDDDSIADTTGPGRQGIEVHISATPRNIQVTYEKTE